LKIDIEIIEKVNVDKDGDRKTKEETKDRRYKNHQKMQDIEKRISWTGDSIEIIHTTDEDNGKQMFLAQNIQDI